MATKKKTTKKATKKKTTKKKTATKKKAKKEEPIREEFTYSNSTGKAQRELVYQMFGLRIIKEIDKKTKKMHLQIKSKSEGLPMAEAILLVEGWLKAEKKKMIGPVYENKQ